MDKHALQTLFNGKNISILGNAKTVLNWENGEKINNHDIIIRVNDFTVEEKYDKYIGNRTDIIFINNHMAKHMSAQDIFGLMKKNNSKILLTKFHGKKLYKRLLNFTIDQDVSVGSIMDRELDKTFQHKYLSTGSICVACLLLIAQPGNVFTSGFDFYLNENQYYNDDRFVIDMNHDKYREIEYWKRNIINNPCVEVDPAIWECMNAPLERKPETPMNPAYSRPPIGDKNISVKTLDLRHLDKNNLEINCDNNHHWQILLGNICRHTKAVISTESDVLYIIIPHKSNCTIKTVFPRTKLLSPCFQLEKVENNIYRICHDPRDIPCFNITIDDNILMVIILDWFEGRISTVQEKSQAKGVTAV